MARLGDDRYYAAIEAETAKLAATVTAADPAQPVPTCPEWTLRELWTHTGRAHRWVEAIVSRRATAFVPPEDVADVDPPDGAPERAAWLRAGAARLVASLRAAGPQTVVWSWSDEQRVAFWARRMTYETVVHRVDAEIAAGRRPQVDLDLAADGIAEALDLIALTRAAAFRTRLAELRGDGQTLHLHATDEGLGPAGEWLIHRNPDGVSWEHGHRKGDVAVRGPAAALFLMLARRLPVAEAGVEVFGDEKLLTHWIDHTAF